MTDVKKTIAGQALIVVVMFLSVAIIISSGLTRLWQTEFESLSVANDGVLAFYLAQAGVERGKAELKLNWGYEGISDVPLGAGNYTVDILDDNLFDPDKTIIGIGRVRKATHRLMVNVTKLGVFPEFVPHTWRQE